MLKFNAPVFLFIVGSLVLLPIQGHSESKPRLILNDIQWPPYLFSKSNAEFDGFATEIFNVCFSELGYDVEYTSLPVKRTKRFMETGQLDITIYSHKASREAFVEYGNEPIFTSEYGFAVAYDRNIEMLQLEDILPYTIGHLAGLSHTPELLAIIEQKIGREEVVESNNVDIMLQQLIADPPRIDIIPNSKETFYWRIKRQGLETKVKVLDFVVTQKDYFVTVSKASQNITHPTLFLSKVDGCLINVKLDGRYSALAEKYGLRFQ